MPLDPEKARARIRQAAIARQVVRQDFGNPSSSKIRARKIDEVNTSFNRTWDQVEDDADLSTIDIIKECAHGDSRAERLLRQRDTRRGPKKSSRTP